VQIDLARSLAAPPALIFATVADIMSWPQIIGSVTRVELLTPGPIGLGTRLSLGRIRFGVETTEELEIATMDRPHRLRLVAEDRGMRYELDHMVDAVFGAGSRLMLAFRTRPNTAAGRVLADFARTFMELRLRDELEQDLADLAVAIEAQASDLPASA
jgi:hypothetical protein